MENINCLKSSFHEIYILVTVVVRILIHFFYHKKKIHYYFVLTALSFLGEWSTAHTPISTYTFIFRTGEGIFATILCMLINSF